jgi:osmoprotectant transport system permease protein
VIILGSLLGDAFSFIGRNGQVSGEPGLPTLVHLTLETLKIAGIGMAISTVIAIPIGVLLGHIHRGSFIAINLGNVWRALPSLAVLAIGVSFLGIGLRNVELALIVLAVPPMITNAYVGVDGVDREVVDAARGMGMTGWQIVRQVEVPLAVPLIFAGIRTAALFVVSTTTIAALTGYSGSLGDIINNETSYHLYGVLGAAICIAGLALAVEFVLAGVQRLLTPRGLRLAGDKEGALDAISTFALSTRPTLAPSTYDPQTRGHRSR